MRLIPLPSSGGGGTGDVDVGSAPNQIPNNTIVTQTVTTTISNMIGTDPGDIPTNAQVTQIINTNITEINEDISSLNQQITNITENPPDARQSGEAITTESLEEGMYVHTYRDGDVTKCCRANAATGQLANGYVLTGAAVDATVKYYFSSINDKANDLSAGKVYLSTSTPGRGSSSPPVIGSGHWLQVIGESIGLNKHQYQLGLTVHLL